MADFSKYAKHPSAFDGWQAVVEAYAEGRLEIHVHFRFRENGGPRASSYYCAVFKRASGPFDGAGRHHDVSRTPMGRALDQEEGQMGQPMLIEVRKLVEHPEGVRCEVIPSLVRLQPLDVCLREWVDATDLRSTSRLKQSRSGSGSSLLVHVPEDGELGTLGDIRGQRVPGVGDGEFEGEVVEGGTEVVKALPNDEAEQGGWRVEDFEPNNALAHLRVEFVDEFIRVSFLKPSENFVFQDLQVSNARFSLSLWLRMACHTFGE